MPRYFFSRIPSEKKYSPGASLVAASREPIITEHRGRESEGSVDVRDKTSWSQTWHKILSAEFGESLSSITKTFPLQTPPHQLKYPQSLTCGRSQCQSFGNVPNSLDSPIGDYWHAETPGVLWNLIDRCGLRSATCQHCGEEEERQVVWRMEEIGTPVEVLPSVLLVSGHVTRCSCRKWRENLVFFTVNSQLVSYLISPSCFQECCSHAPHFFKCWTHRSAMKPEPSADRWVDKITSTHAWWTSPLIGVMFYFTKWKGRQVRNEICFSCLFKEIRGS